MYSLGPYVSDYDELDIPLLVPKVGIYLGMSFQPRSRINNHFDIFLYISYVMRRICTNGIAASIKMEVQCEWVAGKTCVRCTTVGQQIDPHYYMVRYSYTGLEQVSRFGSVFFLQYYKYWLNQNIPVDLYHHIWLSPSPLVYIFCWFWWLVTVDIQHKHLLQSKGLFLQ